MVCMEYVGIADITDWAKVTLLAMGKFTFWPLNLCYTLRPIHLKVFSINFQRKGLMFFKLISNGHSIHLAKASSAYSA